MALRLLLCRLTPIDLFISEPKNWASLYTNLYGTRHCKRFVCSFPDWIVCVHVLCTWNGKKAGEKGKASRGWDLRDTPKAAGNCHYRCLF